MLKTLHLVWLLSIALLLPVLQGCQPEHANARDETSQSDFNGNAIAYAELPADAQDTLRAIRQGGPFAYSRDGVVFGNFEHILPDRTRGYYHEYTVKTPGVHNRGTRRIITGSRAEYYYTADHYKTFKRIRE